MLQLSRSVRILLAAERIDMRNSVDGLAAVVKSSFKENVFAGHLFVFVGKRADKVKILSWDSGGFVLYYKRLEQGRFRLPTSHEESLGAQLDSTQLTMLLDGIDLSHVRRPKKWSPSRFPPPIDGAKHFRIELLSRPPRNSVPHLAHSRAPTRSGEGVMGRP